jgi:hypothetical protein
MHETIFTAWIFVERCMAVGSGAHHTSSGVRSQSVVEPSNHRYRPLNLQDLPQVDRGNSASHFGFAAVFGLAAAA